MITRDITYVCGNKTLTGFLAAPDDSGKHPGILVCHQGSGLRDHEKNRARKLAGLGYAAFALDMYGEAAKSREAAMALMNGVLGNPDLLRARALTGLAQLKAHPGTDAARLGAVGFCFGGGLVIELARSMPELKCAVAFHPGLAQLPDTDDRQMHAKILVCAGADDPLIPAEAREKLFALMKAAKADWQYINYGNAGHSFTDAGVDAFGLPGFAYNSTSDHRSWLAMQQMFDETFGEE